MIKLYDLELSGNAYKVRLMLRLLKLEHERVPVDLFKGEHMAPEFLRRNAFHQVPVIDDGGFVLRDSQAILLYLAAKYGKGQWLPADPEGMARVAQWLSTAANELQHGPGKARVIAKLGFPGDLQGAQDVARSTLKVMDAHLADREWLELGRPTIADVACFPYTALAPEGNVPLDPYPNVRAWIARVKALDGFVPMQGI